MPILKGLTNLRRYEIDSFETVLDSLYLIFSDLKGDHYNGFATGQLAVLITGMGLVNEIGRITFC